MHKEPRRGLRSNLTIATIALGAVAVVVAVALVVVTTRMHDAVEQLATSLDGVHLAVDVETDLLLHDRARSSVARSDIEGDIHHQLAQARELVGSTHERALFDEAEARVGAYLAAPDGPGLDRAYAAMERLVNENVAQGLAAQRYGEAWDVRSNIIGASAVLLLLVVVSAAIWWLQRVAFQSIFELARRMNEYASGNRDARAAVKGPQEIALLAARFNEMAASLAQKRERQLSFIAAIAHDLRNPLAAIAMATSVDGFAGEARARRMLGVVRGQSERLNRMVGDLLDSASIESGKLDIRLGLHDLRQQVTEVAELYGASSPAHEIVVSLPAEPVWAHIDTTRIHQVIGNLVGNAVKYSPQGGTVKLALTAVGGNAVLAVSDEGIGIPVEDRTRIFEPFRRAPSSERSFPGLGLGVSVVKRIVEAHGGHVELDSEVGRGTTFRVILPCAAPAAVAREGP